MIFEFKGGRWHCGLDVFFSSEKTPTEFGVWKFNAPQILKVDGKPFDKTAYYESFLLPADFESPPPLSPSPFSPPPPHPHNVACLFDEDENGELHLDYTAMVDMFYSLVHPDCDEFTIDHATGLRTIRHSFCNMAILPDFIAENPAACRLLDLCP